MHKRVGYAELVSSKLRSDKLLARRDAARLAKLRAFLGQHQHASQWAACVAALTDAARQNLVPSSEMLCDAIRRCGLRGRLDVARNLYTDFHREIHKPRSLQVHVAFMAACAECGNFGEAHDQFVRLWKRDAALLTSNAKHVPVVSVDLTTEYLRAALAASRRRRGNRRPNGPGDGNPATAPGGDMKNDAAPPWEVALGEFFALQRDHAWFSRHNALTPVMVELLARLWEVGGAWEPCLRFLHRCGQQNVLIPPEAHDAAIRVCYRHGKYAQVVGEMQQMIATRSPPDERSVRLALVACEECVATERADPKRQPSGWVIAVSLFDAMRKNGVTMYQQDYESPLRSCAMAGRWEEAIRILDVMRKENRPISAQLYRLALAARIEACASFAEAQRFAQMPVMQNCGIIVYLALLRCCMRRRDWKNFDHLNKEMRERECPETFDKMRLLIEAAYLREQWHAVLMRFARFESISRYEEKRVLEDKVVRPYPEDFDLPESILEMVLAAYERVKGHKDPVVDTAYRAALKRKAKGTEQLIFSSDGTVKSPPQDWMFSQEERDKKMSPVFF
ncbi:uncharacterized protein Tco025E_04769 [Trypanosoma conorhini]|uniref:Pentacotripeptide-repeat region of PRORP domain-containing protein n=1 Tax=Trypanosoma conorhini TaxID=83891 RepID=A0A422PJ31_9TRYP|nr:uncharacterized protein Tco025E_04769 [Trypanosoma conorhini]RNF17732.1 hypothetical protein Tco025E_04769 [Trypanosoma conorhini]